MKPNITFFMLALTLSLLASCGSEKEGSSRSYSSQSPVLENQQVEGRYKALLRPLNIHLSGFIPVGAAEFKIEGDDIEVKTLLEDDASVIHMQSIHAGTRCPRLPEDDQNRDGVIDIREAYAVSGKVLIPLDSDLDSAEEGQGIYPVGSGFTYIENSSFTKMEDDVRQRTGQKLNLRGRVVLIHGVDSITALPPTAAALSGMTAQASVPIGCGVIFKL